ncbi:MAG: VWA domain-containing protein [Kiritimatiellaeota bacterium]|nr:VWA domain-containing protein [Kiritimatiellota bacterium]
MMPDGFGYHQRSSDRNWMLASIAILLSAVFHVVVMRYFADMKLLRDGLDSRPEREYGTDRMLPMPVEIIPFDPVQTADKVPGERDTPSRGPIEVSDKVGDLSQEAPPALVTPPPVPRDAISPDSLVREAPQEVDATPWIPRQEIKQIFDRKVQDELAAMPRHEIPVIERVPQALDVVPAIDLAGRQFGSEPEPPAPIRAAEVFDTAIARGTFSVPAPDASGVVTPEKTIELIGDPTAKTTGDGGTAKGYEPPVLPTPDGPTRPLTPTEQIVQQAQQGIETLKDTVEYTSIDDQLRATLETFRDPQEPGKVYFRIAVQPRPDAQMPVIPKDIVWVQDVSGSMTEERLLFCRRAMTAALETMNPQDRFAVIAFRNTILTASQGWQPVTDESIKTASSFIGGMRSFGSTDIFGSLKTLMTLPRDPQRPMVVLIVTDGKPTAGMTESSEIIGAFSRLNNGMMSIYMYGTHKDANVYLIDMLTYSNRGTSEVVKGNRWDIPTTMAGLYLGFRNPIMSDVSLHFDSASQSETYPLRVMNLYQNTPMEIFGVCPATQGEILFQARGLAFDKGYDSVFRLPLSGAAPGKADIKNRWARQKMFHLASIYSRDAQSKDETLNAMRQHSQAYNVPMPYPSNVK